MDREKVIETFDEAKELVWTDDDEYTVGYNNGLEVGKNIALAMLKEQETKYPKCEKCGKKIDHIITSVFNYDGSDSEYSIPITYEDEGCIHFSTTQNWTGYELSDTEQKDGIRCPFCHEFPFDANEEIELYEPEEVVVMMWEGRRSDDESSN
jgi:DNA-directed RNA polymerase subunit RPC12/RpoP